MTPTPRCVVLLLAALVAGAAVSASALAQSSWPARPVRIVVPYPPGTGPDVMARAITDGLTRDLKGTFVVENRAGANGILGTDAVVKAPADGYTFLLVDRLTLTVNPLLYQPLPYEPKKDIVSVTNIADVSLYLVANGTMPVNDYKGFVAHVKANPGKVTFGTGGVGSIMHLNMELLQSGAGLQFLHVPYKALAEVIPAMLGGQVDATSGGAEAILQHVAAGKMKLLAIGAPARSTVAPSVPTIQEAAGADLILSTSYTMHARAGTPAEAITKMHDAVAKVLAAPELQASTSQRGLRAGPSTPQELDAQIAIDGQRIGRLVQERGIRVQ